MAQQIPAPEVMKDIHLYLVMEVAPFEQDLFTFWSEVAVLQVDIKEVLRPGGRLSCLNRRHKELTRKWRTVRQKAVSLDALISHDDPQAQQKIGELLSNPVFMETIRRRETDVSSVMRDITENLRGNRMEADFKRSGLLSVLAIAIAGGSIVTTVLISFF